MYDAWCVLIHWVLVLLSCADTLLAGGWFSFLAIRKGAEKGVVVLSLGSDVETV